MSEQVRRSVPDSDAGDLADNADKYDQMVRLADLFDAAGEELRSRARLGPEVLADPALIESAELARRTHARVEEDVRSATTGKNGLLGRSLELDADALVVRATVLTYRWIDELQSVAYHTLGSIAGRAIGYLAPEVALGGMIVSAGLIETDALDRDGVAAYLSQLAESNPELLEHLSSGGGGLLDALQMRSLLTAGFLSGESGRLAARGGLRAAGVDVLEVDCGAALRDVAGGLVEPSAPVSQPASRPGGRPGGLSETTADGAPRTIADLMLALAGAQGSITVQRVAESRYIAYLPGPDGGAGRRLRLVGGDHAAYTAQVVRTIESAVAGDPGARVMLVGSAAGGVTAAEVAFAATSQAFVIDQVVTAGAPSAGVRRMPVGTRVLSLEDRHDPVALLGSLVNAASSDRLTVVFDSQDLDGRDLDGRDLDGECIYVAGGRAADQAEHPELKAEISRIQGLGYLVG